MLETVYLVRSTPYVRTRASIQTAHCIRNIHDRPSLTEAWNYARSLQLYFNPNPYSFDAYTPIIIIVDYDSVHRVALEVLPRAGCASLSSSLNLRSAQRTSVLLRAGCWSGYRAPHVRGIILYVVNLYRSMHTSIFFCLRIWRASLLFC